MPERRLDKAADEVAEKAIGTKTADASIGFQADPLPVSICSAVQHLEHLVRPFHPADQEVGHIGFLLIVDKR